MVRVLPESAKQLNKMVLIIYGLFAVTVFILTVDWKQESGTNGKEGSKVPF